MTAVSLPAVAAQANEVRTDGVCFRVHNEGDPQTDELYGVRYYEQEPTSQMVAVILVHGAGPTLGYWDVRPDFSIARSLAMAGYLVFAYDRLGYGRSVYERPSGAT